MGSVRVAFLDEVERLRRWVDSIPVDQRSGEWECAFPRWNELYTCWSRLVEAALPTAWTQAETDAVLFALARDNEAEHLAGGLADLDDREVVRLAEAAACSGDQDARWQMAVVLGDVMMRGGDRARMEAALLRLANDSEEYVRRRALESLARTGSVHAEQVALAAWNEAGKNAPWSRMMALWSLKEIQSHSLDPLLREAMTSDNEFLREFATKLRAEPPSRP